MRILTVSHYYVDHPGGIEVVAHEVAVRLARMGAQVTWAASGPAPRAAGDGIAFLPMPAWNFAERRLDVPYPIWAPWGFGKLLAAVRKCDVLHIHDCVYMGSFVAFLFARMFGIPVVITQHVDLIPFPNPVLRFLHWLSNRTLTHWMMSRAHAVVFCSEKIEKYFSRFVRFDGRQHRIEKGVASCFRALGEVDRTEIRRKLGLPLDRKVILFVGRFAGKKGLKLLRQVVPRFPDCQWVFVGWGNDDPAKWNLSNVLRVAALPHPSLSPYYQAADLLVLPSVGEGFPLVLQEAMACGTPALTSSETAEPVPDITPHLYVAELDAKSLEAKIREALSLPNPLAKRLAVAAYARGRDDWSWERSAAHHFKLFSSLASVP